MTAVRQEWELREWLQALSSVALKMRNGVLLMIGGDEEREEFEHISVGLEAGQYDAVFSLDREYRLVLAFENGYRIEYDPMYPNRIEVDGTEEFEESVRRFMDQFSPKPEEPDENGGFMVEKHLDPALVLRTMFRFGQQKRCTFRVCDRNTNNRILSRISSSWLLDTCEDPLDAVLEFPDGDWIIYHFTEDRMIFRQNRIDEAGELLDQINTETGGYT